MEDQSQMCDLATSGDTTNAISSGASADGHTPCDSLDTPTSGVGPAPAPAKVFPRRGNKKGLTIPAICGPLGSGSLKPSDLRLSSVSKSLPLLGTVGSTLFAMTWKDKVTPSGRLYSQLVASALRTGDSDSTGWPTPTSNSVNNVSGEVAMNEMRRLTKKGRSPINCLGVAAHLASWPTPVANDDNKSMEAHLAMKKRMGERDGTRANRTAITSLAVMVKTVGRDLNHSGPIANGSPAETTNTGRLNVEFVRWLMGSPQRVELLKGYGNAIVPILASKFIQAFIE